MKSLKLLLLCLIPVCMLSCRPGARGSNSNSITLEEQENLLIPLDSVTTQSATYFQLINDSTLAFLNGPSWDICIVDLNNLSTEKIKMFREGPDAVLGIDAFCYVSPDSIWLFASWGKRIYRINEHGELLEKHEIPDVKRNGELHDYRVTPYAMTTTPYIVDNKTHYLQGLGGPYEEGIKVAVTMIYFSDNDSVATGLPYPKIYGKDEKLSEVWSTFGYREPSYLLTEGKEMLTSFAASDSIYIYNPFTGGLKSYFMGYSSPTSIRPQRLFKQNDEYTDYLSQYSYGPVLHDKGNKLYYRELRIPYKDYDEKNINEELLRKPVVVIISDTAFSLTGEVHLPNDMYMTTNSFVNSKGLHIQTKSDDDDFMRFRVFKPIKIN